MTVTGARDSVRKIITEEPVSVGEKLTLRSIAAVLGEIDIGVVLVRCGDRPPGIVSERDVVRALGEGADPDVVWGPDVMAEKVVTVGADVRIIDVAFRMIDDRIRHVAVADDEGEIVGIVSMRDLFAIIAEELVEGW
jgi:CBS domain-containing protein